jgi:hypothetical protein
MVGFNHEPGDEFQVGLVVHLLLCFGEDKTTARLQTGGSTLAECRCDRLRGFLQEHVIRLHVRAVVGLLVKEIAELREGLAFPGTEKAVDIEDLLGMGKAKADIAVVEHIDQEIGLKRIDGLVAPLLAALASPASKTSEGFSCRKQKMTPGVITLYSGCDGTTV